MLLREMQEEDLDEIERLEGLLFTPAWSKEDFLHELKTNETGADIDVELKPKGIKIVVNSQADRNLRKPNALQNAATELFNEINIIREEISKSRLKLQQWSKAVQNKFDL